MIRTMPTGMSNKERIFQKSSTKINDNALRLSMENPFV
jgi:hypothetical protein